MSSVVPNRGPGPRVVARIVRFFKGLGITRFAYRSGREPAITAMIDKACALSGRKGTKLAPGEVPDGHAITPDDIV